MLHKGSDHNGSVDKNRRKVILTLTEVRSKKLFYFFFQIISHFLSLKNIKELEQFEVGRCKIGDNKTYYYSPQFYS
jgi:hypothetical protein